MDRMVDDWDEISFNTTAYRDSGISILTSVDDIQTNLDDQIVKTQTMRGSPFIKPFEERIRFGSTSTTGKEDSVCSTKASSGIAGADQGL